MSPITWGTAAWRDPEDGTVHVCFPADLELRHSEALRQMDAEL